MPRALVLVNDAVVCNCLYMLLNVTLFSAAVCVWVCLSHNMSRSECLLLFIYELYTHHCPQHRSVSSWAARCGTNNLLSRMMEQKLLPSSGCMHMKRESLKS